MALSCMMDDSPELNILGWSDNQTTREFSLLILARSDNVRKWSIWPVRCTYCDLRYKLIELSNIWYVLHPQATNNDTQIEILKKIVCEPWRASVMISCNLDQKLTSHNIDFFLIVSISFGSSSCFERRLNAIQQTTQKYMCKEEDGKKNMPMLVMKAALLWKILNYGCILII